MNGGPLTPLQVEATRLFFSLPASAGFAVAGGAALIARGLITRPTQDVDLFLLDTQLSTVASAAAALETAMDREGWSHSGWRSVRRGRGAPTGLTSDTAGSTARRCNSGAPLTPSP